MHKHHIIPRYRCKELGIDPDFPENIIELTRDEHIAAHRDRYRRLGDQRDLHAANILEGQEKSFSGVGGYWKGKKLSEEHKKKLSEANKGKKNTEEQNKKIGASQVGRKHTKETKKKISEGRMGNQYAKGYKQSPEHIRKRIESMKKTIRAK